MPIAAPRTLPARRRRRQSGHTLVELVIVATITSIVLTIAMRGTQPMTAAAVSQRDRAVASTELRMAVEALLSDLGGAERIVRQSADSLRIEREQAVARLADAWTGTLDQGIVYSVRKGRLLRDDIAARTRVIMARGITLFELGSERGLGTTITLGTGQGLDARKLTLVWPE